MNLKSLTIALTLVACAGALAQTESKVTCPVMGGAIHKDAGSTIYKGILVRYCCGGCQEEFEAKPEEFFKQAEEKQAVVGVSLFDPISHKRVTEEDAKATFDYNGVRWLFQSQENRAEFESSPELYAASPSRHSLTCPVMGSKMESPAQAEGYMDHKGVRWYFCCGGCDVSFASNPDHWAEKHKDAVTSVDGKAIKSGGTKAMMPTCAGCAGEARLMTNGKIGGWTVNYRFIAMDDVAARHRLTLDYALTSNFSIGLERSGSDSQTGHVPEFGDDPFGYLRKSDGDALVMPRFTWFVTPETTNTPSVVFGAASDRLSTPRGQAFFLTFAKSFEGSPFTPFVSVKTNTFDGRTVFPFGVNWNFAPSWTLQAINDGDYTHLLATKMFDKAAVSLILARSRYIGFSVAFGF